MEESLMGQCLAYFNSRPVFAKLFRELRAKYAGLGHLGGNVMLRHLTAEEKQHLEGFFQKDISGKESISISFALMDKTLHESRFAGLSWEEILTAYFGEPLMAKKEREEKEKKEREQYFNNILQSCQDENTKEWLQGMLTSKSEGSQLIGKRYRENPTELSALLERVFAACSDLPVFHGTQELLAIFSARITGNPHCFDKGTAEEALLFSYLKYRFPAQNLEGMAAAEKAERLFLQAGILKDALSNFCLTYQIQGEYPNGRQHRGMEGFFLEREPVLVTLQTISNLGRAWADTGNGENMVYIVENPAIFAYLMQKYPNRPCICGNGQPRLALLMLLDLLKENHSFYYAGDFDPEGLQIAQRFKDRYKECLEFWNYEPKYYETYLSEMTLSEKRLKKLQHVHDSKLLPIRRRMETEKRAAYQEAMKDIY